MIRSIDDRICALEGFAESLESFTKETTETLKAMVDAIQEMKGQIAELEKRQKRTDDLVCDLFITRHR